MPAHPALASSFVTLEGIRLHYLAGGQGRPVLFIHGLGSSGSLEWRRNLDALAHRHRVVAVDLPGFGASDKPRTAYRLDFLIDTVARFLTALGIPRAALVGASLGGRLAAGIALQQPDRVERLCLVDPLGFGRPRRNWAYLAMVVPGLGEVMLGGVAAGLRRLPPMTIRRLWAWYLRRPRRYAALLSDAHLRDVRTLFHNPGFQSAYLGTLRALARRDDVLLGAAAAQLRVPTLLIWGAEDRLFPVAHGEAAARAIPGARLEIFAGCGHTPQLEAAERFNALLDEFLSGP